MNNQYVPTTYYPPQALGYSGMGQPQQPLDSSSKWIFGGIALLALFAVFGSNASYKSGRGF